MKKRLMLLLTAVTLVWSSQAQKAEIFSTDGKAIKGYDPVAFFVAGMPVMGADSLAYEWKNTTWLFSSAANKQSFINDPEKYAPQFGGYCAYGTSEGHKAPTETDTWTIYNDKLYFNYNKKVQEEWLKNKDALIKNADTVWPDLKDKD